MRGAKEAPAPRNLLNFRRASLLSRNEFESWTFTIVLHATSSFTYVSVIYGANFPFKRCTVTLFSDFMSIFCGRKWRQEDSRPRRWPTSCRPGALFSFLLQQWSSKLCNRLTSESQSVAHVKWFFYRTKVRLWELIKNVRTKRRGCLVMAGINNCEKCLESETGLHSSTGQSWAVLVRRSSLMIFQVQLCDFATQYNVHCGKRQAGHSLRALRLEKCTGAIIFPHNTMAQKIAE